MLKCIYRYKYIDISIFPGDSDGKESDCSEEDPGSFDPWVGKMPWSSQWQHTPVSCLEDSMDRGAWQATVHGVTKSRTQLRDSAQHSMS